MNHLRVSATWQEVDTAMRRETTWSSEQRGAAWSRRKNIRHNKHYNQQSAVCRRLDVKESNNATNTIATSGSSHKTAAKTHEDALQQHTVGDHRCMPYFGPASVGESTLYVTTRTGVELLLLEDIVWKKRTQVDVMVYQNSRRMSLRQRNSRLITF